MFRAFVVPKVGLEPTPLRAADLSPSRLPVQHFCSKYIFSNENCNNISGIKIAKLEQTKCHLYIRGRRSMKNSINYCPLPRILSAAHFTSLPKYIRHFPSCVHAFPKYGLYFFCCFLLIIQIVCIYQQAVF